MLKVKVYKLQIYKLTNFQVTSLQVNKLQIYFTKVTMLYFEVLVESFTIIFSNLIYLN